METLLSSSEKYLIGVSGGSDSMALLSMCVNNNLNVVVAFVNYKLRESADIEEELVESYCLKQNIKFCAYYPYQTKKGNFQKWAREARYDFYEKVYYENDCDALLLGHQMDDCIENYLMSKARNSKAYVYGIAKESYHHNMRIIRPLLAYRKAALKQYCDDNNIPYHDDESNFSDKYQRNRIRHQLVETANDQQIDDWMAEINELNNKQLKQREYFEKKYPAREMIKLDDFMQEKNKEDLIRWYLYQHNSDACYSSKQIQDIVDSLKTPKGSKDLKDGSKLIWEYGFLYVFDEIEKYEYCFEQIEYLETPYFKIEDRGKRIEGITLKSDDFPIVIRPYNNEDVIALRYGHKKVNRYMIDNKIFKNKRYLWPVVVNRKGEVVFVSGIGCDVNHYSEKPNIYIVF